MSLIEGVKNRIGHSLRCAGTMPVFLTYVSYLLFLIVLHLHMNLTTGDTQAFVTMLDEHSLFDVLLLRYETWGSRLLIEAVLIYVVRFKFLWACLDIVAFLAIFHYLGVLAIRMGADRGVRIPLLALLLCYPYPTLSEAGWIPTTVNYIWPLACGLFAISIVAQVLDGDANNFKVSAWEMTLAILASLFAANLEQIALVMWCLALVVLLAQLKTRKVSWYLLLIWILISLECLFIVTCPGNHARTVEGIDYWWPDLTHFSEPVTYDTLSPFDKFYLGFASMFDGYLYGYYSGLCGLAALLSLAFVFATFQMKARVYLRILSIVVAAVFVGIPLARFLSIDALSRLTQYPLFGDSLRRAVVSALEMVACVGVTVLLGSKMQEECASSGQRKLFVAVWIICLLSRIALGFTVSLFGSGYRIMLPVDMACIWLTAVVCKLNMRSRSTGQVIFICILYLAAASNVMLMFPNVTLWA